MLVGFFRRFEKNDNNREIDYANFQLYEFSIFYFEFFLALLFRYRVGFTSFHCSDFFSALYSCVEKYISLNRRSIGTVLC